MANKLHEINLFAIEADKQDIFCKHINAGENGSYLWIGLFVINHF